MQSCQSWIKLQQVLTVLCTDNREKNCTAIWEAFSDAFIYRDPCTVTPTDYQTFISLSYHKIPPNKVASLSVCVSDTSVKRSVAIACDGRYKNKMYLLTVQEECSLSAAPCSTGGVFTLCCPLQYRWSVNSLLPPAVQEECSLCCPLQYRRNVHSLLPPAVQEECSLSAAPCSTGGVLTLCCPLQYRRSVHSAAPCSTGGMFTHCCPLQYRRNVNSLLPPAVQEECSLSAAPCSTGGMLTLCCTLQALFWEKNKRLVLSYSDRTRRMMSLGETLIGWLGDDLAWCGRASADGKSRCCLVMSDVTHSKALHLMHVMKCLNGK